MTAVPGTITLVVADDHVMLRTGFIHFIGEDKEVHIIGEADNGHQLLQLLQRVQPHIIIMDIKMPVMDGFEAATIIARQYPSIAILMLSMSDEDCFVKQAWQIGAKGYLLKDTDKDEVLTAVKTVHAGGHYYCKKIADRMGNLLTNRAGDKPVPRFSNTEINILNGLCKGLSHKEIADQLRLAKKTIDNYVERLLHRTETRNSVQLAVYAIINQLVTKDDLT